MSYDPNDAMYDAAMDSLYADFEEKALAGSEIYDRIVDDFRETRLRDFYLNHPKVTDPAEGALAEAQGLLKTNTRCSLVLAATASEVCLNQALLTPILHGSFHSKNTADLIAALIVKNDRFTNVLLQILTRNTGVDLRTFCRPSSVKPLSEEMREIGVFRNKILHQAQDAPPKEAERAIKIAECLIYDVFQRAINKVGLHLHHGSVCGSQDC